MYLRTQKELNKTPCKVIPFEREANYYCERGNRYFYKNKWGKALLFLKKAIEIEPENAYNHYNLGCALSKMGQLEEANKVFQYIITNMDESYSECYFLMAVNFGLMEEMDQAQKYLNKYLQHSPEGEMAWEAHELLWVLSDGEGDLYTRDAFLEEQEDEIVKDIHSLSREEFIKKYEGNPLFWKAANKILYQGCDNLKEELLDIMLHWGSREARDTLKEYVRNPWAEDHIKKAALLKLERLDRSGWRQVCMERQDPQVDLSKYPTEAVWKKKWLDVLEGTLKNMRKSSVYDEGFFEDVKAIWIDFINSPFPRVPRILKTETWSAGLEYTLARFHFLNVTQRQLSAQYGVSPSSVKAKFKIINDTLQIDQKAYLNMLAYFSKRYP